LAVLTSEPSGDGRLQAWLIAEDSTALIASSAELYDSELGENCVPGRFEDGELYCIPSNQFGGEAAFNDPECTQPVRACHEEMCLGRVVYDVATDLDSCASEHLVVNVWRTLSQATGYYGTPGGGPCVELGQPEDFHWVVEAVAESELPPLSLAVAD
jgi:hypothetical protein